VGPILFLQGGGCRKLKTPASVRFLGDKAYIGVVVVLVSTMIAAETVQGLERLGIVHETDLPYSAFQNGKQEVFWAQAEGRLLAMLENCKDLMLAQFNEATLARPRWPRSIWSKTAKFTARLLRLP
jgi:hypothetical protein